MSKRLDLENMIFGDLYVLEFNKRANTHAQWKCFCMPCNNIVYVTSSNLKSGNTKSCRACGQKSTTYKQEFEIISKLARKQTIVSISKNHGISRGVIYRVIKEWSEYK